MDYTSFMIRKTRLEKNWSQDGLCKDICTASYLSKIEQGKAHPSEEIVRLLFERLGICWNGNENECGGNPLENAYELLFSGEMELLRTVLEDGKLRRLENSPWGIDYMLLMNTASRGTALDEELELLMEPRQLALQRILQGRWSEAIRLNPCSYTYYTAGYACYGSGDSARAVEYMHKACTLASEEGYVQIMLQARMVMGACYANLQDFESMERHYTAARRMACALGDQEELSLIDYNIAATCIEAGRYEQAMTYFETQKESDSRMVLHKLAICCEKLGRREEALAALDRAETLPDDSPEKMESEICRTVRLRLMDPGYLDAEEYGKSLLRTFSLCRRYMPIGFCLFHMSWMIEWYEHRRQYKQVAALLLEFPGFKENKSFNPK